jgi:4-amino-4-deoxy-L-arabinose transferase-like glycosyltransferase
MAKYSPSEKNVILWVSLISIIYCVIWFAHYGLTPLANSPALDNQQTLMLAGQMADGTLPAEPFHRAPLYPYILSLGLSFGISMEGMPDFARALNALAFLLCISSVTLAAVRLWRSTLAGWISGLLVGLNPVILFFAADPFDILLATACLCLALSKFIGCHENPTKKDTLIIGLLLACGAALRSHLLPLALAWPIACLFLQKRQRFPHVALAVCPLMLSFLLLGWVNLRVSGEFRMLPWQSAYNLYAGNGPDASGRIYTQKIRVEFGDTYDNPAKLESIALYQAETGHTPPHSIDAMNDFWKQKAVQHIRENPLQWLGLMTRKAYYFLNNYEQYDNKTYGFHKQLHSPLRWNPIHWGALLLLAVAGTLIGFRSGTSKKILIGCIIVFTLYAAGTIWFYTPNRFRVPMIPVLCLLSGGIVFLKPTWMQSTRGWKGCFIGCLGVTGLITYSAFFNADNTDTWEEDYALLANAALRVGEDESAIYWANQALEMNPQRSDMHGNVVQAEFNQWAFSSPLKDPNRQDLELLLARALNHSETNASITAICGIYYWKLGRTEDAFELWNKVADKEVLATLALYWNNPDEHTDLPQMSLYLNAEDSNLLELGVEARRSTSDDPTHQQFHHLFKSAPPESK